MPDRDIFTRTAVREWRTPLRFFHGAATESEVADACLRGLARALRARGGLGQLEPLTTILCAYDQGRMSQTEALRSIQSVERQAVFERHTRVAAHAARSMLVTMEQDCRTPAQIRLALADASLRQMISAHVFEVSRPEFTDYRFGGRPSEQSAFEQACWQAINSGDRVRRLAERVCSDPSGRTARVPVQRGRERRSTVDWLSQTLN